ncbi:hypothetical protein [Kribbella sp. VKM Ac-2566]|uniref:hypothetical protein n=1 Tax=Kribbella sp. VKM Ac-2566 TaxID=2512218 RepID=UPI001063BD6E|nr:hypothetical protein [Kribbella sp. VKM Ac-2566]TDW98251.1 hypothetical protein EV647_2956 [Kribbella sp. VKM Ac-2566]
MSLTVALDDPTSLINAFFDEHLPHQVPLIRSWERTLRQRAMRRVAGTSKAPHLVGAAIEIRIGLDLAQVLPYADLAAPVCSTTGHDAIKALGYGPTVDTGLSDELSTWHKVGSPSARELDDDRDLQIAAAKLCWQMAYVETVAFELPKTSMNSSDALATFWAQCPQPEPPDETINALLNLWHRYATYAHATLAGFGEPVKVKPSFASRFAAGDLLIGHTLIEVKCEQRPEESLPRTLRQVLGCALAEPDDDIAVDRIGVYHGYEGSLVHWTLTQALQILAADDRPSGSELRARRIDRTWLLSQPLGDASEPHRAKVELDRPVARPDLAAPLQSWIIGSYGSSNSGNRDRGLSPNDAQRNMSVTTFLDMVHNLWPLSASNRSIQTGSVSSEGSTVPAKSTNGHFRCTPSASAHIAIRRRYSTARYPLDAGCRFSASSSSHFAAASRASSRSHATKSVTRRSLLFRRYHRPTSARMTARPDHTRISIRSQLTVARPARRLAMWALASHVWPLGVRVTPRP